MKINMKKTAMLGGMWFCLFSFFQWIDRFSVPEALMGASTVIAVFLLGKQYLQS